MIVSRVVIVSVFNQAVPFLMGVAGMLEMGDGPRQGNAEQDGGGEGELVVLMEVDLRQEVGEGDTEEHPGKERQGRADAAAMGHVDALQADHE